MIEIVEAVPTAPSRTPAQVLANLGSLGSPEAIAAHLAHRGIRGRVSMLSDCPIARYLRAECGPLPDMLVGCAYLFGPGGTSTAQPEPVREFIREFDEGHWPALIDAPEATP